MNEQSPGRRSGVRDNGLRCGGYVAIGDLDPRVADSLLDTLRAEGIAAYASPTPASRGGYLELRLPDQLTDRVYADATRVERAKVLYASEKADAEPEPAAPTVPAEPAVPTDTATASEPAAATAPAEVDVDAAWKQLLTSLQTSTDTATWPTREDVGAGTAPATFNAEDLAKGALAYEPEDEHFVPPQPPPLPKLRRVTVGALAAILGGIAILVTGIDGGDLWWLGILGILGGGAALVWHIKEGPPTDSGWDDGAVV